jgi:signal transduction histidine kinase
MTATVRQRTARVLDAYPGRVLRDVLSWVRNHPWQADSLLALVLAALSQGQIPRSPVPTLLASVAVVVLLAATVIPRRRYPVAMFTAAAAIAAAQIRWGMQPGLGVPPVHALEPTATDLVIAVQLYTLAAHRPRRISIVGLVLCLAGAAVAIGRWGPAHAAFSHGMAIAASHGTVFAASNGPVFAATVGLCGITLAAWVLGDSIAYRYRRVYYASLEERAARAEAERDAQVRIAAAAERARELQERRAKVVDEAAARLRRIERDLHDGAQVRLAALALALGEIKENLEAGDDSRTLPLVAAAHDNAKQTLAELRDLARGIHPPVLDRGLGPALSILRESSAVPVTLSVSLTGRPSPAIEAIAYFCAAELLANATKHSGADRATITVTDQDERLLMTITDNGSGGARLTPAGGLAGLLERVQTVDGHLTLDSPAGGPTVVTVELPGHA